MYDKERNIVLSAEVGNADDIIVTTVDDDGNTLVSVIDDDADSVPILDLADDLVPFEFVNYSDGVDSVPIIDLADDSISLELVDCSDGDIPDILPSRSSSCSHRCCSHTKQY